MQVQVLFFAALRDWAGTGRLCVELEASEATVTDLVNVLSERYPALSSGLLTALVAVNHEYASHDDPLSGGDEVAFFPPVSGGASGNDKPEYLAITDQPLDPAQLLSRIVTPTTGAVCIFSGVVREQTEVGDNVLQTDHLIYEAYRPMAETKLHQVAREIRERFPDVHGIAIVQRIGKLESGQITVLVACSSSHRHDSIFEATRYGIDRLKEIVPVWKQEIGSDGVAWVEGHYRPTLADHTNPFLSCSRCGRRYPLEPARELCICGTLLERVES